MMFSKMIKFSKVSGHKSSTPKSVLYTCNLQSKHKINNSIYNGIKNNKIGINLLKWKTCCKPQTIIERNYKEDINKWKDILH